MTTKTLHAVTGAFGYSGQYIARRLLAQGKPVITLTNSTGRRNPFGEQVRAYPFNFDNPDRLVETLRGVAVLYNTYWVRFNHRLFTHQDAVANTKILFAAAREAGVERIVHISITNPDAASPLEYFRGKAVLEQALIDTGVSHAILRPTVIFGKEDILLNNIAWVLRRLPVFGVFGDGRYRLQPIFVEDLAAIAVREGESRTNTLINAIGPQTFTYRELVEAVSEAIGVRRLIISVPPQFGYLTGRVLGALTGDVVITREEIDGLTADLLHVDAPPAAETRLTDWMRLNAETLGCNYTSELARRVDRASAYSSN